MHPFSTFHATILHTHTGITFLIRFGFHTCACSIMLTLTVTHFLRVLTILIASFSHPEILFIFINILTSMIIIFMAIITCTIFFISILIFFTFFLILHLNTLLVLFFTIMLSQIRRYRENVICKQPIPMNKGVDYKTLMVAKPIIATKALPRFNSHELDL